MPSFRRCLSMSLHVEFEIKVSRKSDFSGVLPGRRGEIDGTPSVVPGFKLGPCIGVCPAGFVRGGISLLFRIDLISPSLHRRRGRAAGGDLEAESQSAACCWNLRIAAVEVVGRVSSLSNGDTEALARASRRSSDNELRLFALAVYVGLPVVFVVANVQCRCNRPSGRSST